MSDRDDLRDLLGPDDHGLEEMLVVVTRQLTRPPDELTRRRHLRAIARARRVGLARRIGQRTVASVVAAAAAALALAYAGALPDGAQRVVADAAGSIGWSIPHPDADRGGETDSLPEPLPDELPTLPDDAGERANEVHPVTPGKREEIPQPATPDAETGADKDRSDLPADLPDPATDNPAPDEPPRPTPPPREDGEPGHDPPSQPAPAPPGGPGSGGPGDDAGDRGGKGQSEDDGPDHDPPAPNRP